MAPMAIWIVEFWRRSLDGREYCSNRIFETEFKARKYLRLSGYRILGDEEFVYHKDSMRAILTERTVE